VGGRARACKQRGDTTLSNWFEHFESYLLEPGWARTKLIEQPWRLPQSRAHQTGSAGIRRIRRWKGPRHPTPSSRRGIVRTGRQPVRTMPSGKAVGRARGITPRSRANARAARSEAARKIAAASVSPAPVPVPQGLRPRDTPRVAAAAKRMSSASCCTPPAPKPQGTPGTSNRPQKALASAPSSCCATLAATSPTRSRAAPSPSTAAACSPSAPSSATIFCTRADGRAVVCGDHASRPAREPPVKPC
jgi:hypothetical protein